MGRTKREIVAASIGQHGEFAGGGVSLHLAVPVVIAPATEVGDKRGAFLGRELLDGGFDFLHGAHGGNGAAETD